MKEFKSQIKEYFSTFFKGFTLEKVVVRLVIAWLFINVLTAVKYGSGFASAKYAADINFPMFICFVVLVFISLSILGKYKIFTWIETYSPMVLITIYGYITIEYSGSITYVTGIAVFLAVAIFYAVNKSTKFFDIKRKTTVIVIYAVSALLFILYVGSIAVLRYTLYRNPNYDFGIWTQMFYYMKKCFKPLTTCERQNIGLMSHFKVHFSPIYYFYLPFYMVFPYPVTLNLLQVFTIISGLVPVMLLCKRKNLSKAATATFGVMFAIFPAIACGTFYDLHENCFLLPLILWLFYFLEKDNWKVTIIFTILTLLVKEDAAVFCACIGLYAILGLKRTNKGVIVTVMSLSYFIVVTVLMNYFGLGIMDNRFTNYMVDAANGGLIDVIRNFVTNPAYVIEQCFSKDKLEFILLMTFPVGFLSFMSKKAAAIILIIPILLENLVSNYQYQHSIFFQYIYGSCAILFYLAIVNYAELSEKTRRFLGSFAICMGIMLAPVCALSKTYYFDVYKYDRERCEVIDEALQKIPQDASVSASTFFVPHLANRDYIYEYPYDKDTDYIVLDMRFSEYSEEELIKIEDNGYKIVDEKENLYIVYKNKK